MLLKVTGDKVKDRIIRREMSRISQSSLQPWKCLQKLREPGISRKILPLISGNQEKGFGERQ